MSSARGPAPLLDICGLMSVRRPLLDRLITYAQVLLSVRPGKPSTVYRGLIDELVAAYFNLLSSRIYLVLDSFCLV